MSLQREREDFMIFMTKIGHDAKTARELLAMSATHGRLAVAACNGDYPADNGVRKTKECSACGSNWVSSSFKKGVCPDCRIEQRIVAHAAEHGYRVEFQGDPRGYTVKVLYETDSGIESYYGVPQRN